MSQVQASVGGADEGLGGEDEKMMSIGEGKGFVDVGMGSGGFLELLGAGLREVPPGLLIGSFSAGLSEEPWLPAGCSLLGWT